MVAATAQHATTVLHLRTDRERIASIEGMRAMAMVFPFLTHFWGIFASIAPADISGTAGLRELPFLQFGISLFMTLTGYGVYSRFMESEIDYFSFLKRRLARLLPFYWLILAAYLGLSFLFPLHSKLPAEVSAAIPALATNVVLLPMVFSHPTIVTVAGSLWYFIFAYIGIPLAIRTLRFREGPRAYRVALICAGIAFWFLPMPDFVSGRVLGMAGVGMLVYEMGRCTWSIQSLLRKTELPVMAVLFVVFLLWMGRGGSNAPVAGIHAGLVRSGLVMSGQFLLCVYLLNADGCLGRFFARPLVRELGRVSYSFYLLHGLSLKGVHLVLKDAFPQGQWPAALWWLLAPVLFMLALGCSVVAHHYVERPLVDGRCAAWMLSLQAWWRRRAAIILPGYLFATVYSILATVVVFQLLEFRPVPRFADIFLVGVVLTAYLFSWQPACYLFLVSLAVTITALPANSQFRMGSLEDIYRILSYSICCVLFIWLLERMRERANTTDHSQPVAREQAEHVGGFPAEAGLSKRAGA